MIYRILLVVSFCAIASYNAAAQEIRADLPSFDKIVIGPKINLELVKGAAESIQITFDGIEEDRINYEVVRGKLHIYLDDARYVEKSIRWNDRNWPKKKMYEGVTVNAKVAFNTLESLDIRGEGVVNVSDITSSQTFRLQVYGEPAVYLEGVESNFFKAQLYGEPHLTISGGFSEEQVYRVYGDAVVRCENFPADWIRTTTFGESELALNGGEIKITALGDGKITYVGNPHIRKSLVLGDLSLVRSN